MRSIGVMIIVLFVLLLVLIGVGANFWYSCSLQMQPNATIERMGGK